MVLVVAVDLWLDTHRHLATPSSFVVNSIMWVQIYMVGTR